jgi:hypothetical protein
MPRGWNKLNLVGQSFGRLKVVEAGAPDGRRTRWRCTCECGNEALIRTEKLRSGATKSCGCLKLSQTPNRKHGFCDSGVIAKEYWSWHNAKRRCHDPKNEKYHRYGGRGILMCDEWRDNFAAFIAHMGRCPPGHTLDRIENDKGYEPGNCRWATPSQQALNRDNKQLWATIRQRKTHPRTPSGEIE